ncbi:hypothetical protein DICPUDRAFT_151095 [Dictyostelium purpureum]|uniref:Uncharacterized protein n=1 Tax=Dictyostelium purpureum TaxID=5786 RepID=F0ZHZ4_DICPU|nr:uncharacterized protein DICPUDRAFT_151095 [Dictyostelium purpureum]EGC36405.1 hypothetical protein DICPUDRAFT_151095 [Dictyostelium purpureum]|eukprot:XP_003287038.1 hypothetical protein DICPUDRAFT_151095 [Dictyostelium purpureum]
MISNYDENYETIKNEFYNLYNNVLNINDSLNYHNNTIRELYLNENSTLNLLNRYYGYQNDHPIGTFSGSLLFSFKNTFDTWTRDQQTQYQTINRYITQLESVKGKIERLGNTNPSDSLRLKNEIFKDVQQQFDNRVNQFDIPIINIQYSFNSLIQSLNSNLNESSASLQRPINFSSPVSHLRAGNPPVVNNNLVRNPLPQISKPAPSRPVYTQPQVYSPTTPPTTAYTQPQVYSPTTTPPPQSYQQHYPPQHNLQQQNVTTPPPPQEKKTVKSSLRTIERPPPVALPESTFIEPEIKRRPGDFLKDPNAPRFVPEKVEPISKKHEMSHHNMSLSEQYQKTKETRERMAAERKEAQDRMNADRSAAQERMNADRSSANQRMNAPPPPPSTLHR